MLSEIFTTHSTLTAFLLLDLSFRSKIIFRRCFSFHSLAFRVSFIKFIHFFGKAIFDSLGSIVSFNLIFELLYQCMNLLIRVKINGPFSSVL